MPLCARDGSVITWGRGEGEALSHHVVSTQCAVGLRDEVMLRKITRIHDTAWNNIARQY